MALFGRAKGLSRDWGDNADSDTICRARRQWGIADAVGFGAGSATGSMVRRSVSTSWSSTDPIVLRISPTWV